MRMKDCAVGGLEKGCAGDRRQPVGACCCCLAEAIQEARGGGDTGREGQEVELKDAR